MRDDKFIESLEQLDEKELLQCMQAAILADTEAPVKISLQKAERFVGESVPAAKVVKMKIPWIVGIVSLAAAVALAAVLFFRNPGEDIGPVIADEGTPSQEIVEEHAIEQELTNDRNAVKTAKSEPAIEAPVKKAIPIEVSQDNVSHAAANEIATFELISPSKSVYRIKVVDESKSFSFQWNPEGIETAKLILQDKAGNVFLQKDFTTEDHYNLLASDALVYGDVLWSLQVRFENGNEARNSGVISFVKAE